MRITKNEPLSTCYFVDDYNEARLKLPEAVKHTDLGTDGEGSPIKLKRQRM